jgi:hypothetical protein
LLARRVRIEGGSRDGHESARDEFPGGDQRGVSAFSRGSVRKRQLESRTDEQIVAMSSPRAAEVDRPATSRRCFLTRAAGVSAVVVPTLTLMSGRKSRAAGGRRLTGVSAELINEIMSDEDQHVPIIQNLLGDPANPLPVPIRQPPNLFLEFIESAFCDLNVPLFT